MIIYKDECVDCGLPCLGSSCPLVNIAHYYCDICGREIWSEEIYCKDDNYVICNDCHEKQEDE